MAAGTMTFSARDFIPTLFLPGSSATIIVREMLSDISVVDSTECPGSTFRASSADSPVRQSW